MRNSDLFSVSNEQNVLHIALICLFYPVKNSISPKNYPFFLQVKIKSKLILQCLMIIRLSILKLVIPDKDQYDLKKL